MRKVSDLHLDRREGAGGQEGAVVQTFRSALTNGKSDLPVPLASGKQAGDLHYKRVPPKLNNRGPVGIL